MYHMHTLLIYKFLTERSIKQTGLTSTSGMKRGKFVQKVGQELGDVLPRWLAEAPLFTCVILGRTTLRSFGLKVAIAPKDV